MGLFRGISLLSNASYHKACFSAAHHVGHPDSGADSSRLSVTMTSVTMKRYGYYQEATKNSNAQRAGFLSTLYRSRRPRYQSHLVSDLRL